VIPCLLLASAIASIAVPAGAQGPASERAVTIYRNPMSSRADLRELQKTQGRRCARRRDDGRAAIVVGRRTDECTFRTPVVGKDIDLSATVNLSKSTPRKLRRRIELGIGVRVGDDDAYELEVLPFHRRIVFSRTIDGDRQVLLREDESFVRGPGKTNRLTLRVFGSGVLAEVNGRQVSNMEDVRANAVRGRDTTLTIGSTRTANKARGLFDSVKVRVPDPNG
jgi:hypothetical protein